MDDYAREMMDLKTLVTRTLEKKGVLAKIRVKSLPPLSLSHPFPAIMIDPLDGRGLVLVVLPWELGLRCVFDSPRSCLWNGEVDLLNAVLLWGFVESSVNLTCVNWHGNPLRDEIGVEKIFQRSWEALVADLHQIFGFSGRGMDRKLEREGTSYVLELVIWYLRLALELLSWESAAPEYYAINLWNILGVVEVFGSRRLGYALDGASGFCLISLCCLLYFSLNDHINGGKFEESSSRILLKVPSVNATSLVRHY